MKKIHRFFSVVSATILSAAALVAFAACDTDSPEITITYTFLGKDYEVDYTLSRKGSPQTVQHFIELADAGYYDGTCIHDYQSSGFFLYGGAYVYDESTGEIVEKDYLSEVRRLESEGNSFTQTVFAETAPGEYEGLYTVHGEFSKNGVEPNTKTLSHTQGALVMYYTDKGSFSGRVRTVRADGGDNNEGDALQDGDYYKYNCATSMFYTFTGSGTRTELDEKYSVFGTTSDYSQMQELLDAINDYIDTLTEESDFYKETKVYVNEYDYFEQVVNDRISATYNVPVEPIVIKSVVVNKY